MIVYDHTKIDHMEILQRANSIHKNLQFTFTQELKTTISFLDLLIHITTQGFKIETYR